MRMFQIIACFVISGGVVVASGQPLPAAESRPNILICMADDASYPHTSISPSSTTGGISSLFFRS